MYQLKDDQYESQTLNNDFAPGNDHFYIDEFNFMISIELRMVNPKDEQLVNNIRYEKDDNTLINVDPSKAKKYFSVVTSMLTRDANGTKYIDEGFRTCQKEDFERKKITNVSDS